MPSDGALIIDTGLNNNGLIRDRKQFKSALDMMVKAAQNAGMQMAKGANAYTQAISRAQSAARGLTGEQAEIQKEIAKTEARLQALSDKQEIARRKFDAAREAAIQKADDEFRALNAGMEAMPWESPEQAAQQFEEDLSAHIQAVIDKFGVFEETTQFANLTAEAEVLNEKLSGLRAQLDEAAQGEGEVSAEAESATRHFSQLHVALSQISMSYLSAGGGIRGAFAGIASAAGQALGALGKFAGHASISFLKKLASGAKNAAIQLAKLAGSAIKGGMKKLGSLIGGAAKSLFGFNRASKMADGSLKNGLMSVLKYGLGIRGLFALFRKLRTAVKEGFEEMSKSSPEVKGALDSLKGALNGLKGSLATAFAPILTSVAPALTKLINMLTSAINSVGAFTAALTGQKTYQAAVAGLEATGSAASSASNSVKDLNRQLAGFDQLNILSDSSSSSGSGGSGSAGSGLQYETQEISGGITDFVQKLKDLWANADYEGIGREIAGAINGAFEKAKDLISWDNLGAKITQAVDAITGIFNGLVDGIDWDLIGRTFGTGVNTILNTINQLLTKIDWANLGKKLAEGLNGLVDEVDWALLGEMLGNRFKAALQLIGNFLATFDWANLGTKLSEGINSLVTKISEAVDGIDWSAVGARFGTGISNLFTGIDWEKVGATLAKYLNTALTVIQTTIKNFDFSTAGAKLGSGIDKFLKDLNWAAIGQTILDAFAGALKFIAKAIENIDWKALGAKLVKEAKKLDFSGLASSFYEAIGAALGGLAATIAGFINEAFKGIKGYFDKSIEDAGGNVVAGIFNGIINALKSVGKWIVDHIFKPFIDGFKKAFGIASPSKKMEGPGENIILGVLTGIVNALKSIGKWIKENIFNPIIKAFKSLDWASAGRNLWAKIKGAITNVSTWFKEKFNTAVTAIKNIDWKAVGKNLLYKIKTGVGAIKDWFKEKFNTAVAAIKNIDWKAVGANLLYKIKTGVGAIKDWFKDKFNTAVDAIKNINWKAVGANLLFKIKTGIGAIKDWFKDKFNTAVDAIKNIDWSAVGKNLLYKIKTGIGAIKDWFKDKFNTAVDAIKNIDWSAVGKNLLYKIKTGIGDIKNWFKTKFSEGFDAIKNIDWSAVGKNLLYKIKTGIGAIKDWFKTKFSEGFDAIKNIDWSAVGKNLLYKIKTGIGTIKDWFKDKFNEGVDAIKNIDWKDVGKKIWSKIKSGFGSVKNWFVDKFKAAVNAVIDLLNKMIGKAEGGINTIIDGINSALTIDITLFGKRIYASPDIPKASFGRIAQIWTGGVLKNGFWGKLPQYARGTLNAGSLFAAGEAGPEVVGHIGGRTEVLNKSQLASTMFSAVENGMLSALTRLHFRAPAMATGSVLPYEVAAQIAATGERIETTLNANNEDLIQTIISVAGQIVAAIQRQSAAPSTGAGGPSLQQIINGLNRQTQMFGASPLKGV